MKELSINELESVQGGASFFGLGGSWEGVITGVIEGVFIGATLGGKWGGSGGFISGAVIQLAAFTVLPFPMAAFGAVLGMFMPKEDVASVLGRYKQMTFPGTNHGHGTLS